MISLSFCSQAQAHGLVDENFIVVVDYDAGITQIDLESESSHAITTTLTYDNPLTVTYDHTSGRIYWSDSALRTISSALLDGSDAVTLVSLGKVSLD